MEKRGERERESEIEIDRRERGERVEIYRERAT